MTHSSLQHIPARGMWRRRAALAAAAAILVALAAALSACSTKKNTPLSRNWQAFNTRYNVYFNGDEHYKEQLKEMEGKYEDDYSRLLLSHPAEARTDSRLPQPTGDFTRTIEKMQKAIQLHSIKRKPRKRSASAKEKAFRARDEFNPFLHNAWMRMAEAQFLNGDFLGAASTFLYISKHFKWLPKTVTEARLRQAWCYCALNWNYEAENILRLIKEKDLTDSSLRHLYNLVEGDYLVRTGDYQGAIPHLRAAAASSHGQQKNRLWFLTGQIYYLLGDRNNAYEAFRKAGSGASTPYRTKFNARIKMSEVYTGRDIRKEVNSLKAMTRFERNKEYADQIYYAIGNLYLTRGDTAQAKKNYTLAVEKSTRKGIDQALANLALGNILFSEGDYSRAQPCYSAAIPLLPDNYPDYRKLRQRSDVLDELAVYSGNVQLQDSLLRLAAMTPEEQKSVAQRIVDNLLKQEKEAAEAAKRDEYLALQEGAQTPIGNETSAPTAPSFSMNTDKSWYFYNTMTKNAGKTEFQRRWGARKLEDDWRRRNKSSFSFDDVEEPADTIASDSVADGGRPAQEAGGKDAAPGADDPHSIEYYLRQIPSTPEEIATANDVVQEGLYNMGVILKDHLADFPAARREFERLDSRYPDNIYRLDVCYNMYLMAMREDNPSLAEKWRQRILSEFPDTPYGRAMRDPAYFDNLRRMHQTQEGIYEKAYTAYLADDNTAVHTLTSDMEREYPLSPILPKFVFIDALSYLTEGDTETFRERLTHLLQRWPETDMTDMAGDILRKLKAGMKPQTGGSNSRGMLWETRLSDSGEEGEQAGGEAAFTADPAEPHYVVFAFARDSVNANLVLYDVARFNFSSFVVRDFDLEPMSFSNVGLLVVKGFANLHEAEHYRSVLGRTPADIPEGVRPIIISKADFELLLREGRSFEDYFRFRERDTIEKTEKSGEPDPGQPEEQEEESPESSGEETSENP